MTSVDVSSLQEERVVSEQVCPTRTIIVMSDSGAVVRVIYNQSHSGPTFVRRTESRICSDVDDYLFFAPDRIVPEQVHYGGIRNNVSQS